MTLNIELFCVLSFTKYILFRQGQKNIHLRHRVLQFNENGHHFEGLVHRLKNPKNDNNRKYIRVVVVPKKPR